MMTLEDNRKPVDLTAQTAVLDKFPKARERILQLFQQNSSFQSLCEDYRDCLAAWQHWRQASSEEAPVIAQSYAGLLLELEEEVREYLELL
jgi:hypothetical protein